jgi:ferric-dicitrate binding protein FerR (iron transport regulator)
MTDPVEQLVRLAGLRDPLPPERMHRLKEAARAEWREETSARTRRRTVAWSLGALAAAALIVLAVRFATHSTADGPHLRSDIATVEQVRGAVRVVPPVGVDGATVVAAVGVRLRDGDTVDTTAGGLAAVRFAGGASIRVDRGTRVTWVSPQVIALEQGVVYVDSGSGSVNSALEVRTALGTARDIGTRFEVRIEQDTLRIRVRDGLVRVSQRQQTHDVPPGSEVTLDTDGRLTRQPILESSAAWAWTTTLATPFTLEGRSLEEFLTWVVEETGWQLRFARARDAVTARTLTLHGSIEDLIPAQAIEAVLPASGVEHVRRGDALIIQRIAGDPQR